MRAPAPMPSPRPQRRGRGRKRAGAAGGPHRRHLPPAALDTLMQPLSCGRPPGRRPRTTGHRRRRRFTSERAQCEPAEWAIAANSNCRLGGASSRPAAVVLICAPLCNWTLRATGAAPDRGSHWRAQCPTCGRLRSRLLARAGDTAARLPAGRPQWRTMAAGSDPHRAGRPLGAATYPPVRLEVLVGARRRARDHDRGDQCGAGEDLGRRGAGRPRALGA